MNENNNASLKARLWEMSNMLRGNMEANEFKDYILGMFFYYFLSDKSEKYLMSKILPGEDLEKVWQYDARQSVLVNGCILQMGFCLRPCDFFSCMVKAVKKGTFRMSLLKRALWFIEHEAGGEDSREVFDGLFDNMDLDSVSLGATEKDREDTIARLISALDGCAIEYGTTDTDLIGNAYEFLLGEFAADAGKKAKEYYTPAKVSTLLNRLAMDGLDRVESVYDPCCGSASLLLKSSGMGIPVMEYYGQELIDKTVKLARMNFILHGIYYKRFTLYCGDTLYNDHFDGKMFTVQLANPPYSSRLHYPEKIKADKRFPLFDRILPSTKADLAFLCHMVSHMDPKDGRIGILLPQGALFRKGLEQKIREYLVKEKDLIDTVILLPQGIFYGTKISICAVILKADRGENKGNVLFMDASSCFIHKRRQNEMTDADVEKICTACKNREDVPGFTKVVDMEDIRRMGYDLSPGKYVRHAAGNDASGRTLDEILSDLDALDDEYMSNMEKIKKLLGGE